MASTTVSAGNQVTQWRARYYDEYIRQERFARYSGKSTNAVFQHVEELTTKKGVIISLPLLMRLQGNGVTGDTALVGQEEARSDYNHDITVNQIRNATVIGNHESRKSLFDHAQAARPALKAWSKENLRDSKITAMGIPNVDGATSYANSSEGQKDAWVTANTDRVLFGNAVGNYSAGDHSASLLTIDNTDDKLDTGILDLAHRIGLTADPHIRPIKTAEDEEWFVWFVPSLAMRDLRADSVMQQANREAMSRGKDNPLFRGGDLMWGQNIIREIPEIAILSGVGNGGIDVAPCYMCGAQAVGVAWAQRPMPIRRKEDDYENLVGIGVKETRGTNKLMFNDVQHGMVTVYVAGVADS